VSARTATILTLLAAMAACDGRSIGADGGAESDTAAGPRCPKDPEFFCLSGRAYYAQDVANRWAGSTQPPRPLGLKDRVSIVLFDGWFRAQQPWMTQPLGSGTIDADGYFMVQGNAMPPHKWVAPVVDDADSTQDMWVPSSPAIDVVQGQSVDGIELPVVPKALAEAWATAWGWSKLVTTGTILVRFTDSAGKSRAGVQVDVPDFDIPAVFFGDDIGQPPYLKVVESATTSRSGMIGNPFFPTWTQPEGPCHYSLIRSQGTLNGLFLFADFEPAGCD